MALTGTLSVGVPFAKAFNHREHKCMLNNIVGVPSQCTGWPTNVNYEIYSLLSFAVLHKYFRQVIRGSKWLP